jgi:predicted transcriptional regulator
MTSLSTTIRVTVEQRERLRRLAEQGSRSMADTFDAALESLRREQFYQQMADAELRLRNDPESLADYTADRDLWLNADLG